MPKEPYSLPVASRRWSPFLSTFRLADLLLLSWRGILLAAGLWFAWASISSDLMMARVFDGAKHPTTELLETARAAFGRFPFDPYQFHRLKYVERKIASIPPRGQEENFSRAVGRQEFLHKAQ